MALVEDPESLNLPKCGVDSHAHLDSKALLPDVEGVLERAARAGVARIGQVFLSHAAYLAGRDLLARPEIFFLLGIHPSDGHLVDDNEWAALREDFLGDARLRAVGEIGLDYYWKDCPRDVQDRVFRIQLGLARELDMPVVIHSRDAFAETLAVLDEEGFAGRPLLWHCFGGDAAMAETLVRRGWHISIPGPVTYPANQALRDALPLIPEDRLLLETDCPYLSPQPRRGKRNEPAFSAFTARAVAEARGMPLPELWALCGRNAGRFFGLP